MPIYQYECEGCSCRFELKQSFKDNSTTACPQCGDNARRLFSPAAIIFKGSGFYTTDVKQAGDKDYKPDSKQAGNKDYKPDSKQPPKKTD